MTKRGFAVLIFAVLIGSPAAAMVVPLSLSELAARSDLIVRGEVIGLESSWTVDQSTIGTDVTLRVLDLLLSRMEPADQDEITIRVEGGAVAEQEVRTSIDPTFEEGDEGIFFLQVYKNSLTLVGWSQGYLPIENGMLTVEGETRPVEEVISELRAD